MRLTRDTSVAIINRLLLSDVQNQRARASSLQTLPGGQKQNISIITCLKDLFILPVLATLKHALPALTRIREFIIRLTVTGVRGPQL